MRLSKNPTMDVYEGLSKINGLGQFRKIFFLAEIWRKKTVRNMVFRSQIFLNILRQIYNGIK
jgi:hypothetical protein